jgi:hypothetical protein
MNKIEETVNELVDNYINGNISDCKKILSELNPLVAACVAVEAADRYKLYGGEPFRKLLRNWAEN